MIFDCDRKRIYIYRYKYIYLMYVVCRDQSLEDVRVMLRTSWENCVSKADVLGLAEIVKSE